MDRETDENIGPSAAENSGVAAVAVAIAANEEKSAVEKKTTEVTEKKRKRGVLSRIWTGVFGPRKDDFEHRLERISKEEATVLNRMRRRAHTWGKRKRQIILFSVFFELIAVGYAIVRATTSENWKIRAFRVLPMFLLPALSFIMYSALKSFISMREQKDQKTLENLRAERQSKIDELKEKTNYYITQQLIQRYDTDPAAKAAAATVLASKLGSDSGLKLFLENESRQHAQDGKSNDVEAMLSSGLRNRKQSLSRTISLGGATSHSRTASLSRAASLGSTRQHSSETSARVGTEYGDNNQYPFVDHCQAQGQTASTGGWLSRVAALLVGEDPTQCYALICGNCLMHNGLASKEDFPYVTYICPHCRTVNEPKIRQEKASVLNTPNTDSMMSMDPGNASAGGVVSSLADFVEDTPDESATPLATDGVDKTEISAEGNES